MPPNELKTIFVFDLDAETSKRIDTTRTSLIALNNEFNNLGGSSQIGKTISEDFGKAGKAVDDFKAKVENSVQTPTISRHWESEASNVVGSVKKAETAIDNLKSKTYTASQPLGFTIPNDPTAKPSVNPADPSLAQSFKSLDDLNKKTEDTKKSFQSIAAARLDSGQINNFTKEIIAAGERSRQLTRDIANIKRELANPNRTSSIAFLTDELRGAEVEAERLNRKLNTLPAGSAGNGSKIGKLRGFGAVFREFGLTQLGIDESSINAATTVAEKAGVSIVSLGVFGAVVAAGVAIVKISQSIRAEAEHRLKNEEDIAVAMNKQIIAGQEIAKNFEIQRKNVADDRRFGTLLQDSSVDQLKSQRAGLERLQSLTPKTLPATDIDGRLILDQNGKAFSKENEDYQRISQKILALDAQIGATTKKSISDSNTAFNQRFENFKKFQEADLAYQRKSAEQSVRLALQNPNNKVSDLTKILGQVQNSKDLTGNTQQSLIFEIQGKIEQLVEKIKQAKVEFTEFIGSARLPNNPFVKVLIDIDTAGDRAQKKFKDLGDEFVKAAEKADKANLMKKLGLLEFQSQSEGLKFNQEAQRVASLPQTQFASFQRAIESVSKTVEFVSQGGNLNRQIQQAQFYANSYNPNNPRSFGEFNRRGSNDDLSDAGLQIRSAVEDIKNLNQIGTQGTGIYGRGAIADKILSLIPSRDELLKRLDNPATRGEAQFLLSQQYGALGDKRDFEQRKFSDFLESQKNLEFNKKFAREQIDLLDRSGLDKTEKAKQLLNITSPLGNDIDASLQRRIYQANLDAGSAKIGEQKEALEAAKATVAIAAKLDKIISPKGMKIDGETSTSISTVEIVDKTEGKINVLGASPKPENMFGNVSDAFGGFNK